EFETWNVLYGERGVELKWVDWSVCIGTAGAFDPYAHLERISGRPVDRADLVGRYRAVNRERLAGLVPMPGVVDLLREGRSAAIKLAIASSSQTEWVRDNLALHGLTEWFDAVLVRNERLPAKPKPDLYLAALEAVGATAGEAVAFEDSMNGIAAAKAAGIFCVAVPNAMTRGLDLSRADLIVGSLRDVTLAGLAHKLAGNGRGR
ncbi:MAG: HAD-IA family hydrolase, partial [bacterium]